ncbi:MAG: zinc ABC transporter substrate-binding protein, partial [Crinalium sp.]
MSKLSALVLTISLLIVACGAGNNTTAPSTPSATSTATQSGDRTSQDKPLVVTTVAPITNIVSN